MTTVASPSTQNPAAPTESLCPVCLERVAAEHRFHKESVHLVKTCSRHGTFSTLVWQGPPAFEAWCRPKLPSHPPFPRPPKRGCPFDCGLCPDHRQHTCTVLVEVTRRCDLGCPACYAGAVAAAEDPPVEAVIAWLHGARAAAAGGNLQLSGGEPTLRDDLAHLVVAARGVGFDFVQVNTNGLRMARDPAYSRRLAEAGTASVFLQFDGTRDTVYRQIRGRALLEEKMRAVDACIAAGLGVVLVPTLVPGVNSDEVGRILDFALSRGPGVRGVHFQPLSYFGRHPAPPPGGYRLTLPELMRMIESQTGGRFRAAHFRPPGCEHGRCSFHAAYVVTPPGNPVPLNGAAGRVCCQPPEPAEAGARRSITAVARQWAAPGNGPDGGLSGTADRGRDGNAGPMGLDEFLAAARSRAFSVSAMAFQDAWSLDLERLRECCIHVYDPRHGLVPFCAYNLTAADGSGLYRR